MHLRLTLLYGLPFGSVPIAPVCAPACFQNAKPALVGSGLGMAWQTVDIVGGFWLREFATTFIYSSSPKDCSPYSVRVERETRYVPGRWSSAGRQLSNSSGFGSFRLPTWPQCSTSLFNTHERAAGYGRRHDSAPIASSGLPIHCHPPVAPPNASKVTLGTPTSDAASKNFSRSRCTAARRLVPAPRSAGSTPAQQGQDGSLPG